MSDHWKEQQQQEIIEWKCMLVAVMQRWKKIILQQNKITFLVYYHVCLRVHCDPSVTQYHSPLGSYVSIFKDITRTILAPLTIQTVISKLL